MQDELMARFNQIFIKAPAMPAGVAVTTEPVANWQPVASGLPVMPQELIDAGFTIPVMPGQVAVSEPENAAGAVTTVTEIDPPALPIIPKVVTEMDPPALPIIPKDKAK